MKGIEDHLTPERWKEVNYEAVEASKDFRVFCSTIKDIATKLNNYRFFLRNESFDLDVEITNTKTLSNEFSFTLEKIKKEIIDDLQRSGQTLRSFKEYLNNSKSEEQRKTRLNYAKLATWNRVKGHFLELLCLLTTLSQMKSSRVGSEVHNLFSKIGPLEVTDEGMSKSIWTQQMVTGTNSGLMARPDILMTKPGVNVTTENVLSIIECKCVKKLTSSTIRAEFGKAHDLRVNSYTIVSYYNPSPKLIIGAKKLGIDLIPFKLHTKERDFFLRNPNDLVDSLSEDLLKSRKDMTFLKLLENVASEAKGKLELPY